MSPTLCGDYRFAVMQIFTKFPTETIVSKRTLTKRHKTNKSELMQFNRESSFAS
jgi:hypothetical protein